MSSGNSWAEHLAKLSNPDEIKRRTARAAVPVLDLNRMPAELAVKKLREGLESVFYPSQQCVEILLRLVGLALAHATDVYSGPKDFLDLVYREADLFASSSSSSPLPLHAYPFVLTGHAGIGKTEIFNAFVRMVRESIGYQTIEGDATHWPFLGGLVVRFSTVITIKKLLSQISCTNLSALDQLPVARKRAYRDGICMLFADESQFGTQSDASARIAGMLLSLTSIGVAWGFAMNFSSLRRVMARPPEEVQRLLGDVMFLLPDDPHGEDWSNLLEMQKAVAPDVLSFDPVSDGPLLNQFCASQKRAEIRLICIAYRKARAAKTAGRAVVTVDDLRRAYHSQEYTTHRMEVEEIQGRAVTGENKADNLSCPIPLPEGAVEAYREQVMRQRASQVAKRELESAMTAAERAKEKPAKANPTKNRAVVTALRRRKDPPTAEDLKRNTARFSGQQ